MPGKKIKKLRYGGENVFSIETALERIEALIHSDYCISKRAMALLLIQDDEEILSIVTEKEPNYIGEIKKVIEDIKLKYMDPLSYIIAMNRQEEAAKIAEEVVEIMGDRKSSFADKLSQFTMNPLTGIPILLFVLYFGIYKFVGGFGAGTLVDYLEGTVFENYINPLAYKYISMVVPWEMARDLFVGEYGMITLGIRYAVAIILPIVTIFFLVFSIIEDTGYLPRLAMLIDRVFKKVGLSGRAVIPMVLGLGCATMATMVTRTLPTKRERLIATLLLALAVPCSAQMGVILALLESNPKVFLLWAFIILAVFVVIGILTAQIIPGEKPTFYMEIPPLRLPKFSNIIVKTYTRVEWYLKEVLPIFIFASFLIWLGKVTKLFDLIIGMLEYPVSLMGLPVQSAQIFLFGFFRRDYGAAGLYDLNKAGALNGNQLLVACVALTLFLPCIAQLLMNVRERGLKAGAAISIFVLFFSFTVAFLVNQVLVYLRVSL